MAKHLLHIFCSHVIQKNLIFFPACSVHHIIGLVTCCFSAGPDLFKNPLEDARITEGPSTNSSTEKFCGNFTDEPNFVLHTGQLAGCDPESFSKWLTQVEQIVCPHGKQLRFRLINVHWYLHMAVVQLVAGWAFHLRMYIHFYFLFYIYTINSTIYADNATQIKAPSHKIYNQSVNRLSIFRWLLVLFHTSLCLGPIINNILLVNLLHFLDFV